VEAYFREKGSLTEEQETMLEGIYREKLKWERFDLVRTQRAVRGATSSEPARFPNKAHLGALSEHGGL